jgi:hypothetical protein
VRYLVTISGEAAAEVAKVGREEGLSPGEVVSAALSCRKWLHENVSAGKVYVKTKSHFGGQLVTFREVTLG